MTRWALAARDGDRHALAALAHAAYDVVWRFGAATAGRQDADDVAQETFERAVRALPKYRGDSAATTWLIGIARHVCLDHARSAARRRRHSEISGGAGEPSEPGPAGRIELVDVVRGLDRDRRDAFVLTQVMGFRYEEAATICECAVGTIRSRVARARGELMTMLDDREPGSRNDSVTGVPGSGTAGA
jgi:RNA polymerase sigma-70 factor, ECF subfamily